MKNQLKLTFPKPVIVKPKRLNYLDLNIDQKINVKANSLGFASIWLNASRYGPECPLGFVSERRDRFSGLAEKWFCHHKRNKDRPWDALPEGKLFREPKQHKVSK